MVPTGGRRIPTGPASAPGNLPDCSMDRGMKTGRAGRTDVSPIGSGLLMYAACTGPPTVDHVTQVEVRVEVVLVWAPMVVGVNASQADATARSTSDRVELWPTKHTHHFPLRYSGLQPRLRTLRDADHTTRVLLGTASNVLFGFSGCAGRGRCWVTPGQEAYGPVAYI